MSSSVGKVAVFYRLLLRFAPSVLALPLSGQVVTGAGYPRYRARTAVVDRTRDSSLLLTTLRRMRFGPRRSKPPCAFKMPMINVFCNSHCFSQLAAFFIGARAERSTTENCLLVLFRGLRLISKCHGKRKIGQGGLDVNARRPAPRLHMSPIGRYAV